MSLSHEADYVMSLLDKAGAEGDLLIDQQSSLALSVKDATLEEHKVSSSQVFGLRVIKDNKAGIAYSEASDDAALKSMVEQALVNATYSETEARERIPASSDETSTDDSLLCPVQETGIEEKIELALQLETGLTEKAWVKNVPYNGLEEVQRESYLYNSAGRTTHSKSRINVAYTYALLEKGEHNVMSGSGQAERLFSNLLPQDLINHVYDSSLALLEGKPVATGHYDVIFDEECQAQVFGAFSTLFSGKAAKDGINPMRDKVGEIITDPRLTISDQPLLTEGLSYHLFDSEGSLTRSVPLITEGRLDSFVHNTVTAAHFNLDTTGNASRGPKSALDVAVHQLNVAAGTDGSNSLLAGEYLELTDLTGTHSGANAVSGDFSFGASGFLCRDGKRVQPVRGVTVAGNFYQMLAKINAVGDKQRWNWERSALMPAIRFADVAISGD